VRKTLMWSEFTKVVLMDSITEMQLDDIDTIVVAGSHAGLSVVEYALRYPLRAVFFNDAGVGKDGAGIAALAILNEKGIPAGAVAHVSARIGDASDTYANGVLSYVNHAAQNLGFKVSEKLDQAVVKYFSDFKSLD
jgi:hypothetical protein